MEKSFQIDIITPVKTISLGSSEYLRAPGLKGLFGVKAKHVSSVISINLGEIKVTQNGKDSYFATNGGYADIKPEGVILILETFEKSNEINIERSKESIKKSQKRLGNSEFNQSRVKKALKRSQNRLKIAEKK